MIESRPRRALSFPQPTEEIDSPMTAPTTSTSGSRRVFRFFGTALAAGALTAALVATAAGEARAASPALDLNVFSTPTNLAPDTPHDKAKNLPIYTAVLSNNGATSTSGPFQVTAELPSGITPVTVDAGLGGQQVDPLTCQISGQTVTCSEPSGGFRPGWTFPITIGVDVGSFPDPTTVEADFTVTGGGSPSSEFSVPTVISSATAPFGTTAGAPGMAASTTDPDGDPATAAGSHPYQLNVRLGFPSFANGDPGGGGFQTSPVDGGVRDVSTVLPRGLIVNPQATPVRCTEAQLETETVGCPAASQVGTTSVITNVLNPQPVRSPLYNMVPPPGQAATLAFDAVGNGTFIHIAGGVRGSDYALTADSNDILAKGGNPVFGVSVSLWGDPSDATHDGIRGQCGRSGDQGCNEPITRRDAPFLTMPTACSASLSFDASADSWLHPGLFVSRGQTFTDRHGNPTGVSGCDQLAFDPSLDLQPTTQAADSSSGMEVDLSVPQTDTLGSLAAAHLKRAVVTLPEGVALNPSAADALEGCTEQQIGLTEESPIPRFDNSPPACPAASKVGDGTIVTPLLPDPLDVDLYVADPDDNPFHTLLAGYLVAKGQGVVVKIPGRFDRNPDTGQITAVFDNNPQLPFSDLKLHFKGGDRGVIVTPPKCGTYTIDSELVPWSAADPDNPTPAEVVHQTSSFAVTSGPGGGPCPSGEFKPDFEAGTITPSAGAYSPLVVKARRSDGSQIMRGLGFTLPPGLTGRLAGLATCPDSALALAAAATGSAESISPSCPANSKVGEVRVGAGAGATPFHVTGTAYLAGPYKGAPLSFAVITPAVAGPFDLGNVVVRAAAYVDPTTAQIRVRSDELPTILAGIPVHIRSVTVLTNRSQFTLNPTSCDPMSLDGTIFGSPSAVAVSDRFQVGGCAGLEFKPRMTLELKGGTKRTAHPKLIATVYSQGAGSANLSTVQVKLPRSAFLDQAHIRTVCTRVQFAAGPGNGAECPKGSVYGEAQVKTPLFDYTLPGKVFLRSSHHKLPDLVIALQGPASQPIAVELDGKTDSVKGALRNTFEDVPDQPFNQARVVIFGGKRGLVVNSRNLCAQKQRDSRAHVRMVAQSGETVQLNPLVRNSCRKH